MSLRVSTIERGHLGLLWAHVERRADHLLELRINGLVGEPPWVAATPKSITFGTAFPSLIVTICDGLRSR